MDPDNERFPVCEGLEKMSLDEIFMLLIDGAIHPDDRHKFEPIKDVKNLVSCVVAGKRESYLELRIMSLSGAFTGYHWISLTINYLINPTTGNPHAFVNIKDIDVRKQKELLMMDLAQRDVMTGALNRSSFEQMAKDALRSRENKDGISAFITLDLDNFKRINDTYGHVYGDEVLK